MNEITNKTTVIVSRLGDFWVTPEQAGRIMDIKEKDSSATIDLEGNLLSAHAIEGALKADAYDLLQKKRRGGWQCKRQYWHEKNEQCAHHLMK